MEWVNLDTGAVELVPDYPGIAKRYADVVSSGRLPNCRLMMLAAKRYIDMLGLAAVKGNEFYFSPEHVVQYCRFIEKLQHIESGNWELTQVNTDGSVNPYIILEPSQIWVEAAIQGFRRRLDDTRLVTMALSLLPRKSSKSLSVAGAGLFDLCCSGQRAPQITIAASTEAQTNRVFNPIARFVGRDKDLVEQYGLRVTKDFIKRPSNDGEIMKLTSVGEHNDGLNPSLAIMEEGHAGAETVFNVVRSAFGARPNALMRMITTAGYHPSGPGWNLLEQSKAVLNGPLGHWNLFAAIYTLDEDDYLDKETHAIRWDRLLSQDDALVRKANPMYGVSLMPQMLRDERDEAIRDPSKRGEYARTRFNIWTGSGQTLVESGQWAACKKNIDLQDFIGQPCWIGVDLAQLLDMCAIALVFEMPGDILAVFVEYFLPAESPTASDPDMMDMFTAWAAAEDGKYLTLTPGPLADHDRVRDRVEMYCGVFDVKAICCDPAQAHNTVKHLWDGNRPVWVYPNSAKTMTAPTDDLLGRIVAKRVWHDGNPVLAWNMANLHGERKPNGSIIPRKDSPMSKRKIDGVVAICFANGFRLNPDFAGKADKEVSRIDPYAGRGLIGYEETTDGR